MVKVEAGMITSGRKFLPALVIVVTLGIGILIGTVVLLFLMLETFLNREF